MAVHRDAERRASHVITAVPARSSLDAAARSLVSAGLCITHRPGPAAAAGGLSQYTQLRHHSPMSQQQTSAKGVSRIASLLMPVHPARLYRLARICCRWRALAQSQHAKDVAVARKQRVLQSAPRRKVSRLLGASTRGCGTPRPARLETRWRGQSESLPCALPFSESMMRIIMSIELPDVERFLDLVDDAAILASRLVAASAIAADAVAQTCLHRRLTSSRRAPSRSSSDCALVAAARRAFLLCSRSDASSRQCALSWSYLALRLSPLFSWPPDCGAARESCSNASSSRAAEPSCSCSSCFAPPSSSCAALASDCSLHPRIAASSSSRNAPTAPRPGPGSGPLRLPRSNGGCRTAGE
mmetsp:Transcript_42790/g.142411  ORF Transcript_42790/g.142411 Transcript_42790/m.142411 type:complete len:357 (-) Transcript_42790:545-1615(-)